jgi:hypothetical protein
MKRLLGLLILVVAVLVGFAQTYHLLSIDPPPSLQDFARHFAMRSSIECYGFAVVAAVVGFFVLRGRSRFWLWAALAVTITGLWLFIGREVWAHYVELPRLRRDFLATHPYFASAPVWAFVPRLAWHILLPVAVVVAGMLCLSTRWSELPPADAAGSRSP